MRTNNSNEPTPVIPERFDDFSNAQRFVDQFGDVVRYCAASKSWHTWNGTRWESDSLDQVELWAQATLRRLFHEVAAEGHDDLRRLLGGYAARAQSQSRLRAMIASARVQPQLKVEAHEFDRNPWLLNLVNGTLDLQTGKLRKHRREDLIDKCLYVPFNPKAGCPRWEEFVNESAGGSVPLVQYLQRIAGYTLTGDASEESFFLFHGPGGNGKSTFLEILKTLLGPYSRTANFETFLRQREDKVRTDIARLNGARLVTGSEVARDQQLAEALIKQLTGRDTMTARFLFQGEFEYRPAFKIALAMNHLPVIKGDDDGLWRRLFLVPFTVKPRRIDKTLRRALERELPGILNWALAGCLAWQLEGHLGVPAEVVASTIAYRDQMTRGGHVLDRWSIGGIRPSFRPSCA